MFQRRIIKTTTPLLQYIPEGHSGEGAASARALLALRQHREAAAAPDADAAGAVPARLPPQVPAECHRAWHCCWGTRRAGN